jgi:uncharacterized membrane protein (UPF0127 family)
MSRILIHQANNVPVVEHLLMAETTVERMRGLLGRRELPRNTGLLIRPCRSIHMWFMRFPIDAAFLDADLQVLKISRGLRPWQLAFAPGGTHCVLETAAGVLDGIAIGDRLALK